MLLRPGHCPNVCGSTTPHARAYRPGARGERVDLRHWAMPYEFGPLPHGGVQGLRVSPPPPQPFPFRGRLLGGGAGS